MDDSQFPQVAAYVRVAIEQTSPRAEFRELLVQLMSRTGRILSASGPAKWTTFVLNTCDALGGDPTAAVGAAAAVEFAIVAADVADDLVDEDWSGQIERWRRAANAVLALTWLAQRCVVDLADSLGPARACRIGRLVARGALAASDGQDMDLALEKMPQVSAEQVHRAMARKSGSLAATACQVGAAVATEDEQVLSLVGVFGEHVGMVAQLLNDIGGVLVGSDIARRKKTLPAAYALRCAHEEGISEIALWYADDPHPNEIDADRVSEIIRELGGIHYASVVASAHRQEALALVNELVRVTGRQEVRKLRRLVPQVWAGSRRGCR